MDGLTGIIADEIKKQYKSVRKFAEATSIAQNGEPEIVAPASKEINFDEIKDMY